MPNKLLATMILGGLAGCLPGPGGPRPGAVPTGEQLRVVDDVKRWSTQHEEADGHTEVRDADGNLVVDKTHYRTVTDEHAKKIWYPVQGDQQINDEDLFRLSGDDQALTATRDMHASGRTYTAIGTVGMLVGIAGMITGKYVGNGGTLSIGLYSGGAIVGLAGAYGFYRGYEMQSPDSHAVDRSIADTDARRYNQQLGRGASLTLLNGKF